MRFRSELLIAGVLIAGCANTNKAKKEQEAEVQQKTPVSGGRNRSSAPARGDSDDEEEEFTSTGSSSGRPRRGKKRSSRSSSQPPVEPSFVYNPPPSTVSDATKRVTEPTTETKAPANPENKSDWGIVSGVTAAGSAFARGVSDIASAISERVTKSVAASTGDANEEEAKAAAERKKINASVVKNVFSFNKAKPKEASPEHPPAAIPIPLPLPEKPPAPPIEPHETPVKRPPNPFANLNDAIKKGVPLNKTEGPEKRGNSKGVDMDEMRRASNKKRSEGDNVVAKIKPDTIDVLTNAAGDPNSLPAVRPPVGSTNKQVGPEWIHFVYLLVQSKALLSSVVAAHENNFENYVRQHNALVDTINLFVDAYGGPPAVDLTQPLSLAEFLDDANEAMYTHRVKLAKTEKSIRVDDSPEESLINYLNWALVPNESDQVYPPIRALKKGILRESLYGPVLAVPPKVVVDLDCEKEVTPQRTVRGYAKAKYALTGIMEINGKSVNSVFVNGGKRYRMKTDLTIEADTSDTPMEEMKFRATDQTAGSQPKNGVHRVAIYSLAEPAI